MDDKPTWRDLFPLRRDPKGCLTRGLIFGAAAILVIPVALYLGATRLVKSDRQSERPSVVTHAETDPEKWRALLQELSDLIIADEELREYLPPEKVKSGWLGEPPATDAEIAAAEKRLGVVLPPSYKAFLKVSNGWTYPNSFVVKLGSTTEIGWTRDKDPDLIAGWQQGTEMAREQFGDVPPGPDDHLPDTLMINQPHEDDDAAYFMLNPKTISGEEMEAWFFSNWNPGANDHPSFWHLMVNVRDSVRHIHESKQ